MELLGEAASPDGTHFRLYYLQDQKGRRGWILGPTHPPVDGTQRLELVAEFACTGLAHARELVASECQRRGWEVAWR